MSGDHERLLAQSRHMIEASPSGRPSAERLVVGLQPVREAIRAHGAAVTRVLLAEGASPRLDALARFARDQGAGEVVRRPRRELDRLAAAASHQGAAAWVPPLKLLSLGELWQRPWRVALALDQIQDPQNFGACIRSAVALAGAPILWAEHASAPLSLATFRASAGAIEHACLCRLPALPDALFELQSRGANVVGLATEAPTELRDLGPSERWVVVVGSEHGGLRRPVRRQCSVLSRVTEMRHVESLNASVAAAIALYALTRQP
jgi:23S rRNA (guanosine2251-2'-O)-methyltransferase